MLVVVVEVLMVEVAVLKLMALDALQVALVAVLVDALQVSTR